MLVWLLAVVLGTVFLLGAGVLLAAAVRVARWSTEVKRLPLYDHPRNHGLTHEEVAFPSRDGVLLRGWYLPTHEDSRCILHIQGQEHHRNSPGIRSLELGRDLLAHGFSSLLFDLRSRGESQGHTASGGNQELLDVLGALDFVKARGIPAERIGLIGFSFGAGLALYTALREPRLRAVVCDSCFKDSLDDYPQVPIGPLHLPGWALVPLARLAGMLLFNSDPLYLRPIRIVHRLAPRPVFFIHGQEDQVVPSTDSVALYHGCSGPHNRLWLVPDSGHVRSYALTRQPYVDQVAAFFHQHLV